jgi:hypothetical protein
LKPDGFPQYKIGPACGLPKNKNGQPVGRRVEKSVFGSPFPPKNYLFHRKKAQTRLSFFTKLGTDVILNEVKNLFSAPPL